MLDLKRIISLRVERNHIINKANQDEYLILYRDTQPGQNVYWNGFGDPPSLTFRADFDDIEFNRKRQEKRSLLKGRFAGGNLGWVVREDLELFACLFCKPLNKPTQRHLELLELIEREGPMNIKCMKETTGMLVKEITPLLHRLQEAFLIYEDQYDGEWDRGWYRFSEMFADVSLMKYSKQQALENLLPRFSYRNVVFDEKMVKSFYKLPTKEIKEAIKVLLDKNLLCESNDGFLLTTDYNLLQSYSAKPNTSVFAMHRNDFLVKSNEHWLKDKFKHPEHDTLQYILIDGEFHGASLGHFRNGPYDLEDVLLDLPLSEASMRKNDILDAIYAVNNGSNHIKKFCGEVL